MNLLEKVKSTGYPVLRISKETGIPHSRIYKWYEGKGEPKLADSEILLTWLEKVKSNSTEIETNSQVESNVLARPEVSQRNQLINEMLNSDEFSDKEKLMFMLKLYRLQEGEYEVLDKMYKSLSGKKEMQRGQEHLVSN